MRPIKFRVWHKLEKLMFRVKDIQFYGEDMSAASIQFTLSERIHISYCELMQFTGLLDKNGKEIWEGDIIKWAFVNTGEDEPYYTEPVEWNECGFFLDGGAPLTVAMDDCEVIGNIYENPDLLK